MSATASNPDHHVVHIYVANICQWFDIAVLKALVADWMGRVASLTREDLWRMSLFIWQYDFEARHRWDADYTTHIAALEPYEAAIAGWAAAEPATLEHQVGLAMPHLPIVGLADGVDRAHRRILELKFSKGALTTTHALQTMGYAEMIGGRCPGDWTMDLFNIRTGERVAVNRARLSDPVARWSVQALISKAIDRPLANTTWLFDTCADLVDVHVEELTSGLVPLSPGVDDDVAAQLAAVWAMCEEPCVVGTHAALNALNADGCIIVKKLPNIDGNGSAAANVAVLRGRLMHQTPPQRQPF